VVSPLIPRLLRVKSNFTNNIKVNNNNNIYESLKMTSSPFVVALLHLLRSNYFLKSKEYCNNAYFLKS